MIWLAGLGLFSLIFIAAGCALAVKRTRHYRRESESRRARAFAEMGKMIEEKKVEGPTQKKSM